MSVTQCHFKDMKIFPSKFSYDYDTNKFHDPHSHGHDNEDVFNDSIVMKSHEENETLHFRMFSFLNN